ncbi:hypothetical protein VHEMI01305 [[Torrubiella] hemipterigena]|uniref:Amino acid permease/ SLC12A domain-containing protein n=1 Tax=[Torrubiella] hemipterigena TaxID=1531966 RepID=A0A0A1SST3_9HYPO|nr:hypothetical protein VHEMI01305 [[Torrubiella] hemipterigena]
MSLLTYFVLTSITEMAAFMPVRGASMSYEAQRFVSPSLGFAMGWLYVYAYAIIIPFELTAVTLQIQFWNTSVNMGVWNTLALVVVVVINVLSVRVYGDSETVFAGMKQLTIFGLLILSVVLFWGGGPTHDRIAFRYWETPGATKTMLADGDSGRFIAALSSLIASVLPFTFTAEMMATTAGEVQTPRKTIPKMQLHFVLRLFLFFIGSALSTSIICPHDNENLLGGGVAASPWIIGLRLAGTNTLDVVLSVAFILATISAANTVDFLSSRCLQALAMEGNAPSIFKRCNAQGTPIYAVAAVSMVGLLVYLNLSAGGENVFNWLINLVNMGGFLSWCGSSIVYLRFDKACNIQSVVTTKLAKRSFLQPYASWFALVTFALLGLLNGFTVFFPSEGSATNFLSAYLGLPVFLACYFIH